MKTINVGVVGATGVVGETFLNLIEERDFPIGELRLFASENSLGQTRKCKGQNWPVLALSDTYVPSTDAAQTGGNCFQGLDIVFFSSGDDISEIWAPKAMAAGAIAIDNSGAFRMNGDFALVVPEVNGDLIAKRAPGDESHRTPSESRGTIIANPNCSTIQLVVALSPLAKTFGLKSVRVASYQSVSGAGRNGIEELLTTTRLSIEGEDVTTSSTFPAPIPFNCIPQIGKIDDDGFCTEEIKIMKETCKILRLPHLPVSAFTVRVPTLNSHAEVVWVTLEKTVQLKDIEHCLASAPGIHLTAKNEGPGYPTQKDVSGADPVYIGRVHRDAHDPNTWMMWVVSDNLRKGAALNGIQIAEHIFDLK